jgi:hypothetical protein
MERRVLQLMQRCNTGRLRMRRSATAATYSDEAVVVAWGWCYDVTILTGTGIGAVAGGITGGLIAKRTGFNPVGGAVIDAATGGLIGSAIGRSLRGSSRWQARWRLSSRSYRRRCRRKCSGSGRIHSQHVTASGPGRAQIRFLSEAGRHHVPRSDPERQQERARPRART